MRLVFQFLIFLFIYIEKSRIYVSFYGNLFPTFEYSDHKIENEYVVESGYHSKNGAELKSHTSRINKKMSYYGR